MPSQTTDSDNSVISVKSILNGTCLQIRASSTEAAEKIDDTLEREHEGISNLSSRTSSFIMFQFGSKRNFTLHFPKIVKTLVETGYLTKNTSIEVDGQGTTINQILEEEPATEAEPQAPQSILAL